MAAGGPDPTVPDPTPTAEPGYTTTEFWLATVTSASTLIGTTLVDFGVVPSLNAAQRADITGLAILGVSVVAGLYAVARAIRKHGIW